jgi:proteasome lid subunit RPN8/RPN11
MLVLSSDLLQHITNHAERTYPEECCGILLGRIDRQLDAIQKAVVEVMATPNAWSEAAASAIQAALPIAPSRHSSDQARRDRYWIDPQDLLKAQRIARDRNLQVIGIYHSHPDHVAVPSESDRLLAWTDYSYVIVSVQQGKAIETRSWQLGSDHQFGEEAIEVQA